jgi:uncharacterized membrane protein YdjX (TVP38/TMEM64 family)
VRHIVVVVLSLAVTAAVVWAVPPLHGAVGDAFSGDVDALRDRLTALGAWGAVVVVALILVHAVVFFPAEIVNAAAGLALGFGVALPLVLVAWGASGLIAYWLGGRAGRPLAIRVASEARVTRVEELLERGGAPMLLSLRLIPFVPFSLLGYVAGAARVPVWRYTWTSVVGILPITAAATYLGHALDSLSPSDPLLWVAVGIVLALLGLTVVAGRRLSLR